MDGYSRQPFLGFWTVIDGDMPVLTAWTNDSPVRQPGEFEPRSKDRGAVLQRGPHSPRPTPDLHPKTAVDVNAASYSLTLPHIGRGRKTIEIKNVGKYAVDIWCPEREDAFARNADSIESTPRDKPYVLGPGATLKLFAPLDDDRKQWKVQA